ncbi:MAG TPA: hypothetical protein VGK17_00130, partial [Propionicimonas sp.]
EEPMHTPFLASTARRWASAALEATLVIAIGATLVLGFALATGGDPAGADNVFAGKGRVVGTAASSISLDAGSDLRLGGKVTFTTSAGDLGGGEYPMIVVSCSQGGDVVYAQLDHPDVTFTLGGGSSQWWINGGSAGCRATLYAYGGKSRGYDTIRTLAGPIAFTAAG